MTTMELMRATEAAEAKGVRLGLTAHGLRLSLGEHHFQLTWQQVVDEPPRSVESAVAWLERKNEVARALAD